MEKDIKTIIKKLDEILLILGAQTRKLDEVNDSVETKIQGQRTFNKRNSVKRGKYGSGI